MTNLNLHTVKKPLLWAGSLIIATASGCASYDFRQYIPGADRIFHPESEAEVGPVLTESGSPVEVGAELKPEQNQEQPQPNKPTQLSQAEPLPAAKQPEITKPQVTESQITEPKVTKPAITKQETIQQETIEQAPKPAQTPTNNKSSKTVEQLANKQPEKPSSAVAKLAPKPVQTKTYSVSGKVSLIANGKAIDSEGTVITVERNDGLSLHSSTATSETYLIDMEEKTYLPGQMVIRKGDTVSFVNKDEIRHNVFSSSGKNAFDLGTYGAGLQRAVTLNEQGIVKVYCNIHPKMATFVAVDDKGRSEVADSNGIFEFNQLPAGEYTLKAWNVRGEVSKSFIISDNSQHLNITIDTSSYVAEEHTNKFGKEYSKNSVNNEFY
ncbi:plastocyanin/azurin family copper-binding protein [Sessilibacter corallicola]|uniref:plastocyanin/azurin family copper-binding protein n=1 Tax=Sessilibacter corallicola TaxID=2904075 RepID=UPI001E51CE96|nr:plastocyanin/azurin family copper-binding protein [Sessilibacter corallicola]MCE2029165.1 hypothetical protein [Sessilibacter corallicola]